MNGRNKKKQHIRMKNNGKVYTYTDAMGRKNQLEMYASIHTHTCIIYVICGIAVSVIFVSRLFPLFSARNEMARRKSNKQHKKRRHENQVKDIHLVTAVSSIAARMASTQPIFDIANNIVESVIRP